MRAHLIAIGALVAVAGGCAPSCERTCRQLLDCDVALDAQTVALDQCEEQCVRTDALYESWEEDGDTKRVAFDDHRRCIVDATCDELADGACYEEALFPYGEY